MTLENIKAKLKTVLSLALPALLAVLSYFMHLWKTGLSFIVSRFAPSYSEGLNQKKFLNVDLMSWSFGIVLVIILLLLLGIF